MNKWWSPERCKANLLQVSQINRELHAQLNIQRDQLHQWTHGRDGLLQLIHQFQALIQEMKTVLPFDTSPKTNQHIKGFEVRIKKLEEMVQALEKRKDELGGTR